MKAANLPMTFNHLQSYKKLPGPNNLDELAKNVLLQKRCQNKITGFEQQIEHKVEIMDFVEQIRHELHQAVIESNPLKVRELLQPLRKQLLAVGAGITLEENEVDASEADALGKIAYFNGLFEKVPKGWRNVNNLSKTKGNNAAIETTARQLAKKAPQDWEFSAQGNIFCSPEQYDLLKHVLSIDKASKIQFSSLRIDRFIESLPADWQHPEHQLENILLERGLVNKMSNVRVATKSAGSKDAAVLLASDPDANKPTAIEHIRRIDEGFEFRHFQSKREFIDAVANSLHVDTADVIAAAAELGDYFMISNSSADYLTFFSSKQPTRLMRFEVMETLQMTSKSEEADETITVAGLECKMKRVRKIHVSSHSNKVNQKK
jgi:hypothetical protein